MMMQHNYYTRRPTVQCAGVQHHRVRGQTRHTATAASLTPPVAAALCSDALPHAARAKRHGRTNPLASTSTGPLSTARLRSSRGRGFREAGCAGQHAARWQLRGGGRAAGGIPGTATPPPQCCRAGSELTAGRRRRRAWPASMPAGPRSPATASQAAAPRAPNDSASSAPIS